jgi:hypothetical protein
MGCEQGSKYSELNFVQAMARRDARKGECVGPLISLRFRPYRVFVLEHVLDSKEASDLLWDGFRDDPHEGVAFELCAAHWLELAAVVEIRASQYRREDWAFMGRTLALDLCESAQWDPKEIVNLFAWQRALG